MDGVRTRLVYLRVVLYQPRPRSALALSSFRLPQCGAYSTSWGVSASVSAFGGAASGSASADSSGKEVGTRPVIAGMAQAGIGA